MIRTLLLLVAANDVRVKFLQIQDRAMFELLLGDRESNVALFNGSEFSERLV
jgi:hypothetical protein